MFSIMIKKPGVTFNFFSSGTLRKIYLLVFFVTVISIHYILRTIHRNVSFWCVREIYLLRNSIN